MINGVFHEWNMMTKYPLLIKRMGIFVYSDLIKNILQ